MTLELLKDLERFNNLVNPEDKRVYLRKETPKGNHRTKTRELITFEKMIADKEQNPESNYGIDLSQLGLFFIDYDGDSPDDLENELQDLNYVKTKSLKQGHYHYYFKYSEYIDPGYLKNYKATIHDWYKPYEVNPYCPVIPTNATREFIIIPDSLDYLPEEMYKKL